MALIHNHAYALPPSPWAPSLLESPGVPSLDTTPWGLPLTPLAMCHSGRLSDHGKYLQGAHLRRLPQGGHPDEVRHHRHEWMEAVTVTRHVRETRTADTPVEADACTRGDARRRTSTAKLEERDGGPRWCVEVGDCVWVLCMSGRSSGSWISRDIQPALTADAHALTNAAPHGKSPNKERGGAAQSLNGGPATHTAARTRALSRV